MRAIVRRLFPAARPRDLEPRAFWTSPNVTSHDWFASAAESLEYFHWRNRQYHHGYIELMPVAGGHRAGIAAVFHLRPAPASTHS